MCGPGFEPGGLLDAVPLSQHPVPVFYYYYHHRENFFLEETTPIWLGRRPKRLVETVTIRRGCSVARIPPCPMTQAPTLSLTIRLRRTGHQTHPRRLPSSRRKKSPNLHLLLPTYPQTSPCPQGRFYVGFRTVVFICFPMSA